MSNKKKARLDNAAQSLHCHQLSQAFQWNKHAHVLLSYHLHPIIAWAGRDLSSVCPVLAFMQYSKWGLSYFVHRYNLLISFSVLPRIVPPIVHSPSVYFNDLCVGICISQNWISSISFTLSMSSCNCCLLPLSAISPSILVSSANAIFWLLHPVLSHCCISKIKLAPVRNLTYTLLKTDLQFEASSSSSYVCLMSIKHWSIQLTVLSPTPWAF